MKPFDYNKYLQNNPLLKEVDENWNPIKKAKDFLGTKGITLGSARRPTPEEEQIARDYMKSQGKELGSIGVDKFTGNINVMETNGDFRAVLSSDGEELSAWEMQFESSLEEASLQDLLQPLTSKLESMGYEVDSNPTPGFQTLEAYKTFPDQSVLRLFVSPSDEEMNVRRQSNYVGSGDYSTIDVNFTYWTQQIVKRFFGLIKTKSDYNMQDLPDESGKNIDLGTGMFDIPVEQSIDKVVNLVKTAEAKVSMPKTQNENDMQEGRDHRDFSVYDLDPVQRGKLIGKSKQFGISLKVDEVGIGESEVRIFPSNEENFKIVAKILKQMRLDFES